MNMIIRSSLAVPGIYDQDERDITLSFNKKKSEFSYDIDITGADSQAKSLFKSMIEPELKKLEPEMKEQMLLLVPPIMNDMKVISVSKNKLILRDSTSEELTFYPAAKG